MQNYCKTIGALAAASALVAGNASAEVEYQLHTGYSSGYIYRGITVGDNLVEAGFDAATEINGIGLSAGVWGGTFKNAAVPTGNDFDNELDTYFEVSKDFGFMTAAVGYIYTWRVANFEGDNQEIYFQASRDLGFATVSLTYFWDIDSDSEEITNDVWCAGDTEGYTELALTRSFELNQCLTLNVGTNVGYLVEGGDFTAWTSKVSLDWGFVEHAKLSPFVALSIGLGESTNTIWNSTENEISAGTMLSVSF